MLQLSGASFLLCHIMKRFRELAGLSMFFLDFSTFKPFDHHWLLHRHYLAFRQFLMRGWAIHKETRVSWLDIGLHRF